jgi:TetR/AcrR family acrAB operon transcriptional repressor
MNTQHLQAMQMATDVAAQDVAPLRRLVDTIQAALQATVHDPRTRRVFEIATHKVEYVGEMHGVLQRRNECVRAFMGMTEQALATCAQRHNVQLPMTPDMAALGLHMLIDGLIHNWLLDPTAFNLEQAGAATMSNYLRGLGLSTQS